MADTTYKLEWDLVGERYYEVGVDHVVLYPYNKNATDKTKVYSPGVAWNGVTQISENPDGGDANEMWADNIKYAQVRSAETYGGSIEAYTFPDEWEECDGSKSPIAGVTIGQQPRKMFGLSYRTRVGNDEESYATYGEKIHLVYACTATPSERTYETINDSPDGGTFSWDFDTVPVPVTGSEDDYLSTSCITIYSNKVDADKYASLLAILYGSGSTDPYLPLPAEVKALFSA